MTDLDLTEALEAAARALVAAHDDDYDQPSAGVYGGNTAEKFRADYRTWAQAALEAAAPILERQIREQVARTIAKRAETFRGFCIEAGDITRAEVWDSAVKLALDELPAAIARGDIAADTETST